MAKLKLGQKVPDVVLESTQKGGQFKFEDYKGKNLVLFFYPKDSTPGCTLENQQFTLLLSKFKKLNTVVVGVSRDSLKSHEKFISKYQIKCDLVSDNNENLCEIFDVIKEKNIYGKKDLGVVRSTFLVNPEGVFIKEWRQVKADGHAQEVLDYIKEM